MMELATYMARIRYSGPVEPSATVLREVHRHHLLAIPFENLDIHLGREIRLDLERIYNKMVRRGRGGFCYEQNGLFAWALREMGFDLDLLSARVARAEGGFGPEFDHMLLLVRVDRERWLADVGFGDSFRQPLRFEAGAAQADFGTEYKLEQEGDEYFLTRHDEGEWQKKFAFTLHARKFSDYAPMCVFQQTSPESSFPKRLVCSVATPNGRLTLTEKALIITENGQKAETPVTSLAEFERLLRERFGLDLTGFRVLPHWWPEPVDKVKPAGSVPAGS